MNTLIDEYKEAIRAIYGNEVADNLDIQVIDGWYNIKFNVTPTNENETSFNQPTRYRKTQLQKTISNLKAKANR